MEWSASLFFTVSLSSCASNAKLAEPTSSYEEIRALALELRALSPAERKAAAAPEVNRMAKLLETSDEATTVYIVDVLRMAGCDSKATLPTLKSALTRFQGPADTDGYELSAMVVPSYGAWGSIHNAITLIEGDDECGQPR